MALTEIFKWPKIKKCTCAYVIQATHVDGSPGIEWSFMSCKTHQDLLDAYIADFLKRAENERLKGDK